MFRRLYQRIETTYQSELLLEYQQKFAKLPAEELWGGIIDLWLNGKIADLQAAVEKEKKRKINNMTQKQLA